MNTEVIEISAENQEEVVNKAAAIIKRGGLVVFPTETVYGLGANALDDSAVGKIFLAKGRPSDNPVIVHVANVEQLNNLVEEINDTEQKLIAAFWPGPLTIVFKKKKEISSLVSGGLSTVAVRMPANKLAQDIIKNAGVPIAAPSANISGRPSATTGQHAYGDLVGKVDMIIEGGVSEIGVESTVVKVEGNNILILRPGKITKEMIVEVVSPVKVLLSEDEDKLKSSPGTRYKHYAPLGQLEILQSDKEMLARAESLLKNGSKVGIITTTESEVLFKDYEPDVFSLGSQENLSEVSKNLYAALRFFDTHPVDIILCPSFREVGLGGAIMDRLKRAASL